MNEVICSNCAHANTPGSKFCNNCGNRLPPSTEIICPNCQTPNSRSLFYCDNCGARLVKQNLPTEVDSDPALPEQPSQTSVLPTDLFSLPTRKPGDTGKLNLNTLPDWLRTGEREGEEPPPEAEQPPAPEPVKDEPPPVPKGTTDELPDWLLTDSVADVFQSPSEINTEAFLEMTGDEPIEFEGGTGLTDELNLPNWLTDAVKETGDLGNKQSGKTPPESDELPDPFQTTTNIPDWLAEFSGVKPTQPEPKAAAEEEPTVENWNVTGPFDESPDWLTDEPETADIPEETSAELPDLSELADWGTAVRPDAEVPNWYGEATRPNAEKLTDWLRELDDIEEPEFQIDEPEVASLQDRLTDWLSDEDDSDWSDDASETVVTGRLTDWLSDLEDEEQPAESPADKIVTGMLTGWLSDLDDDDAPQADETPESGMLTDWLAGENESDEFDFLRDETAVEPEPDPLTDWLASDDDVEEADSETAPGTFTAWLANEDTDTADELSSSEEIEDESEAPLATHWLFDDDEADEVEEEDIEPGTLTGWLSNIDEAEETAEPEMPSDNLTSWLTDEDETADDDFADETDEAEERVVTGMLTSWLSDLDENEETEATSDALTSWLTDEDETADDDFADETDEAEERVVTGMLTGWLSDLDNGEETAEETAEPAQFTNWLTDEDELAEANLLDEAEEPEPGNFTGWLAQQPEPELPPDEAAVEDEAEVTFTSWLATQEEEQPETADDLTDVPDSLTDWLTQMREGSQEETEADVVAEPAPDFEDWLSEPADDELPDWFGDLAQADSVPESGDLSSGLTGELFGDDADQMGLDWLSPGTGELFADKNEVAESAESADEFQSGWLADSEEAEGDADWMAELDTLDTAAFAADLNLPWESEEYASSAPAEEEIEPEPDDSLAEDEPDEDTFTGPLSEEEAADVFPDWLSDLREASPDEDTDSQSDLIQEELPNWLSNMKPSADRQDSSMPGLGLDALRPDDLGEIPAELSGADLPDWLQGVPTSFDRSERGGTSTEHSSDIPDWLQMGDERTREQDASSELRSILNELPPPRDLKDSLAKAEIPEWLDALKPGGTNGQSQPAEANVPAPESGPLSGVTGAIAIAPTIAMPHAAHKVPVSQLTISPEQQQQAALLQQLAQGELVTRETAVISRRSLPWSRVLLSILLLLVMGATILLADRLPPLREGEMPAPASIAAAQTAVAEAAGQTVLVAFDYTPALAGELGPQADVLMAQLAANGSEVIAVSQSAVGTGVAAPYSADSAIFIPGEAIGLRQMAGCLNGNCQSQYGRNMADTLSQVSLIIILTGDRQSLINWVEQVEPQTNIPLLAATTQSLEPVAMTYLNSGQLNGTFSHLAATGWYEDDLPEATAVAEARGTVQAQVFTQLLLVVVLLISLVWQAARSGTRTRR